jgi:hypothetical protein
MHKWMLGKCVAEVRQHWVFGILESWNNEILGDWLLDSGW